MCFKIFRSRTASLKATTSSIASCFPLPLKENWTVKILTPARGFVSHIEDKNFSLFSVKCPVVNIFLPSSDSPH